MTVYEMRAQALPIQYWGQERAGNRSHGACRNVSGTPPTAAFIAEFYLALGDPTRL